jgi:predicted histidine transporter YuiF (NhaC family)
MSPDPDRTVMSAFGALTAMAAFLLLVVGIVVVVNDDGAGSAKSTVPVRA